MEISAVMLGTEWCLATLQYKMFCEYELWVDENAPFDYTMTFAYTNSEKTYVGMDEELARDEKRRLRGGFFPLTVGAQCAFAAYLACRWN